MHDALANAAVDPITSGMVVGLGTGRAAARAIDALATRVKERRLRITCVATSVKSAEQGGALGLRVLDMNDVPRLDYLFDGADEVDGALRMIKGRGGAMTREKIVARASARRVYLIQQNKRVARLGAAAPLPIEVLPFGVAATRAALAFMGLEGPLRLDERGERVITDNGCPIVDAVLPQGVDLARLREAIDALPGVVGHGLFLDEADEVIVEDDLGGLERLTR